MQSLFRMQVEISSIQSSFKIGGAFIYLRKTMKTDNKSSHVFFCLFDAEGLRIFEADLGYHEGFTLNEFLTKLQTLFHGVSKLYGISGYDKLSTEDLLVFDSTLNPLIESRLSDRKSTAELIVVIGCPKKDVEGILPLLKTKIASEIETHHQKNETDVFICHSNSDESIAFEVLEYLEAHDMKVWTYERDAFPGKPHLQQSGTAIQNSGCVVLLLSEKSMQSEFVLQEIYTTIQFKKDIIPVLIGITHDDIENGNTKWSKLLGTTVSIEWKNENKENVLKRLKYGAEKILEMES